mmetsp:Transcript_77461/g.185696  ORF Transcript_77461/g.185696 Transcript_77461/m.185696 type:complete len:202 (+) Transcript_77461:415-1020(+)
MSTTSSWSSRRMDRSRLVRMPSTIGGGPRACGTETSGDGLERSETKRMSCRTTSVTYASTTPARWPGWRSLASRQSHEGWQAQSTGLQSTRTVQHHGISISGGVMSASSTATMRCWPRGTVTNGGKLRPRFRYAVAGKKILAEGTVLGGRVRIAMLAFSASSSGPRSPSTSTQKVWSSKATAAPGRMSMTIAWNGKVISLH